MVTQSRNKEVLDMIFEIVRMIPRGRVTSYGAIAACIGLRSSARLVGWAMSQSHQYQDIPAHRVVNRQGVLTGKYHFATITEMQELLEAEGITVENDKIVNFKDLFWDPQSEIQI